MYTQYPQLVLDFCLDFWMELETGVQGYAISLEVVPLSVGT